ncbi:MAG: prephenate dehydrogenase [Candidatus Sericytochromatia bacterium]
MRVSLLGLGLIGGSWGLALRAIEPTWHVRGWDRDPAAVATALDRGAIAEAAPSPEAAADADLVLVATPVRAMRELLSAIAPHLPPGALVTDVASTKAHVVAWAREQLPPHAHFLGGHPMAGSEHTGCAHADPGLFRGAVYCLTPDETTPEPATRLLEGLLERMGALPRRMTPAFHDEAVASVSHLPFLLSAALVAQTTADPAWETKREMAATGFRDMTRLAAGDPTMYRDICLTNAGPIREQLLEASRLLADLASRLEDPAALEAFFRAAQAERRAWAQNFEERAKP